MRNYTKHRKGLRKKQTRRLTGGFLPFFGKRKSADPMAAVNDTPDIGNIDSHESAITKKLQAADQALVAAQAAQQRLQQEQVNTGKCASKVKEVIKNKSIRAQQHIFDIKKDLPQLDDQLSKLNAQLSKLNDQKEEADKAFVEANKTLSAVNASAGSEFKKCLENPDNYQSPPIPNIEPTRGLPTPEDPTQRSRSERIDFYLVFKPLNPHRQLLLLAVKNATAKVKNIIKKVKNIPNHVVINNIY